MLIPFIWLVFVFIPIQAGQEDFFGNMTGSMDNTSELLQSNMTERSGAKPPDMNDIQDMTHGCKSNDYPSTACDIVHDLISLPAVAVQNYGLSDQPKFVIKQALNSLDPGNLTKVLQNIAPKDLSIIRDKLTRQTFNTTLSRVPEPERDQILSKLSMN